MKLNVPMLISVALLLSACSSTRFESTWKDPETAFGQLNGQRIAAFLISDNEASRWSVEAALAREVTARGGDGVARYSLRVGGGPIVSASRTPVPRGFGQIRRPWIQCSSSSRRRHRLDHRAHPRHGYEPVADPSQDVG